MHRVIYAIILLLAMFCVGLNSTIAITRSFNSQCVQSGKLSFIFAEDHNTHSEHLSTYLLNSKGKIKLKLRGQAKLSISKLLKERRISSGSYTTISSKRRGSHCVIEQASDIKFPKQEQHLSQSILSQSQQSPQQILAVSLAFINAVPSCSNEQISSATFNAENSVKAYYQKLSSGSISFDGSVVGPLSIPFHANQEADPNDWAEAADRLLLEGGVNPENYERIIYFIPVGVLSSWQGWASIGGSPSRAWIKGCNPGIIAHEIGHNLELWHSQTPSSTYGDQSCIMGAGAASMPELNAAQKDNLNLIQPQFISTPGDYTISAVSTPLSLAQHPQALKISLAGSDSSYYISFRNDQGLDSNLAAAFRHRVSLHSGAPGRNSILYGTLGDGQALADPARGILVRMLSHTSTSALVRISYAPFIMKPVVKIETPDQISFPNRSITFPVEVTNRDSGTGISTRFNLSASLPSGFIGTFSSNSLLIPPASSAVTTLQVTVPANAQARVYSFNITAADPTLAWHRGTSSGSITVLGADTSPPRVSIERPLSNATITSDIKFRVVADDLSGISQIGVFVDGELVKSCGNLNVCDGSVSFHSLSSGAHTISAAALDASPQSNIGYAIQITVFKP